MSVGVFKNKEPEGDKLLKPAEIKRIARVAYRTVLRWIEVGHPRAGVLASLDLADRGHRHSYRIRYEDWKSFQKKLLTQPKNQPVAAAPIARAKVEKGQSSLFRY